MCLAGRRVRLICLVPPARCLMSVSFDADLPLLCNDEDLGESGLKSPAQSPTQMCCFVAAVKLNQILAFALRTLVSCMGDRSHRLLMVFAVLDEEVKGHPWLRWKTVGTAHSCRPRFSPEQVDGHCPRTSCVLSPAWRHWLTLPSQYAGVRKPRKKTDFT